ncbi:U-box domain-containing protein 33-like [Impatiens glandulifera]|uniref:U-box domain-containing protein 33-like n=1 Tax=Impatiens glandulifera TaxID=253017 RepID=UPI001FB0C754|nr:U-box domain-containing protein 33-like [Impatiens glandulifera]
MELLHPYPPPASRIKPFSECSHSSTLRNGFYQESITISSQTQSPEMIRDDEYEVFIAVGKSSAKAITLLHWAFQCFPGRKFCILHVHQPSSLIPTLLGKFPASEANHEVVSVYRMKEKDQTNRLLLNYLSVCCHSKINARIITIEDAHVQKGILDLVNEHGIRNLVIGAMPDSNFELVLYKLITFCSCVKGKRSSNKASHAAKHAPHFCQIWFIYKGKHVWTKASTENAISFPTHLNSSAPEHSSSSSSSTSMNSVSGSKSNSCTEQKMSLDSTSKSEEECLYGHLIEIKLETEVFRMEASLERSKCEHFEAEAAKFIDKVNDLKSACECETKLIMEAENEVKDTIHKQGKLLEKQEEITKKLQKTTRNIDVLESRVQEANSRCEKAASELKVLETSIATLQREKRRIQRQKAEAMRCIDSWKNCGVTNSCGLVGFTGNSFNLAEFSTSDLQTATCDFSESFRIGQGGNGCVYKGELLGKTVAIKMWDPRNIQGRLEFQQEVQILGKLSHSHLATLIGICSEACSVVYEYLPNGSLQNFLLKKSNKASITWKLIARIVAEISSALLFLHSCKPKSIVHGNLKPENILLDSELSCKLCDLGICTSLGQFGEPSGSAHTDPEFCRTGILTMKSDIYSFGLIILQLLTGRSPVGLINEVRRAVSTGKLASILDLSAGEWPTFVSRRLVDLGLQFCKINSKERPLLTTDLVKELQNLPFSEDRPDPSFFTCPILKELMYDPQVAADGFTYEGEAIRTWLENGHESSPMTNLKLDHLHVTPNHSARLAIQDWLCKR